MLRRLVLLTACALALAGADAASARAASSWYDGAIAYSTVTNCFSVIQGYPYTENGMGVYTGFQGDLDSAAPSPQVNQTFYVHIVIAGLGNSCAGQYAWPEIELPANVAPAIDGAHPVRCFYGPDTLPCPAGVQASPFNAGAWAIPNPSSIDSLKTWPVPSAGKLLEFQIPVKASAAFVDRDLKAHVSALDGNASPWLRPTAKLAVFGALPDPPVIYYREPTTITPGSPATYYSVSYLATAVPGSAWLELGPAAGSYGLYSSYPGVAVGAGNWKVFDDWIKPPAVAADYLAPDTDYHWRACFKPTGLAPAVCGADQAFRTPDSVVPKVLSIAPAAATVAPGGSLTWTVTFSEPVTGVDAADISLAASGVAGSSVTRVAPASAAVPAAATGGAGAAPRVGYTTYAVTVTAGSGTGTLGVNLVDDDSIGDLAKNPLGGAGAGNGNAVGGRATVATAAAAGPSVPSGGGAAALSGTTSVRAGALLGGASLAKGLTVKVTCSSDAAASITLSVAQKTARKLGIRTLTLGSGRGGCRAGSTAALRLKLTKAAATRLRRIRRPLPATLVLTLTPAGGKGVSSRTAVRVG